jgi:hypothetical protein
MRMRVANVVGLVSFPAQARFRSLSDLVLGESMSKSFRLIGTWN